MNLRTFLKLAEVYSALGEEVRDQLVDVAHGVPSSWENPDALALCRPLLCRLCEMGDEQLSQDAADVIAEFDAAGC